MKTIKLAFFASLLATTVSTVVAQDFAFKVLVNKGKSEIKSGAKVQAVKVGATLKPEDELNVTANSYVGLVHANGKPLEIKEAGKYKVENLAAKVSGSSSVLNKYTDFILSSNESKQKRLAATGAVHRGVDFPVFLPVPDKNPVVFGNEVTIAWDAKKVAGPFVVELSSVFGDELAKIETKESKVTIDLSESTLKDEDNISVIVYQKANRNAKSEIYTLKRLSSADKQRIKSEFNQVSGELGAATALDKYFEAAFFEENGLLIDATTAFIKAVELEPSFKGDYEDYLKRTGFKTVPKEN
ncbi:hypothetical protein [Pseudochryseolinea flava]|uniref:Uncharacterized protein n=1 Tax=Pseudochryseolinea flava TaxID=2059302 RepID=A0A364XZP8_9BACT|nr:hypothetical protein [Pseudochryseolinea flava]RAV99797.1 hypothetical protein DQQ10_17285 [Pseudochryseolinea flava]